MKKELTASEIGRMGGRVRGPCKARKAQMLQYWKEVRAGIRPAPDHSKPKAKQRELPLELGRK